MKIKKCKSLDFSKLKYSEADLTISFIVGSSIMLDTLVAVGHVKKVKDSERLFKVNDAMITKIIGNSATAEKYFARMHKKMTKAMNKLHQEMQEEIAAHENI